MLCKSSVKAGCIFIFSFGEFPSWCCFLFLLFGSLCAQKLCAFQEIQSNFLVCCYRSLPLAGTNKFK